MTPEEIRAAINFECDSAEWECAKWLREIAGQLAELNQRLDYAIEPSVKIEGRKYPRPGHLRIQEQG